MTIIFQWVARGRMGRVVSFVSLSTHSCRFESRHGVWILSCQEVIQLAYCTSVVLLRCPLVPDIMHGVTPEVFRSKKSRYLTFTVPVRHHIIQPTNK